MSDLFNKEIPREFLDRVFDTMEQAHWHQFQVLTKRSSLMRTYINSRYSGRRAPEHMWFGVSIEDRGALGRLLHLQQARAGRRPARSRPTGCAPCAISVAPRTSPSSSSNGEAGPRRLAAVSAGHQAGRVAAGHRRGKTGRCGQLLRQPNAATGLVQAEELSRDRTPESTIPPKSRPGPGRFRLRSTMTNTAYL